MVLEWLYHLILRLWLPRRVKLRRVGRGLVVLTLDRSSWPVWVDGRFTVVVTGRQIRREGKILTIRARRERAA